MIRTALACGTILTAAGLRAADAGAAAPTAGPAAGIDHWAFQPVRKVVPPGTPAPWCVNDIDRFIFAKQQEQGLTPSPRADKRTLIRRATLDLIGLPPTTEDVDAFEKDDRPDAFDRVVDRLLDSPHYGERWGRYWLDLARYADDEGNSFLTPSPNAYRYRDWVIQAFNRDMPYNEFLRLQIAGDLIPEPATDYVERLGGLGFQGLGPKFRKGAAGEAKAKADELEDRVDTLSRGVLALTVACARCHDHKFDPIPTRDYYSLAAAYNGATWSDRVLGSPDMVEAFEQQKAAAKRLKEEIEKWPGEAGKRIGRQELVRVEAYLTAAWQVRAGRQQSTTPPPDEAAIAQRANVRPFFLTRLLNYLASGAPVAPLAEWRAAADGAGAPTVAADGTVVVPVALRESSARLTADVQNALAAYGPQGDKPPGAGATQPAAPDATQQALLAALWQNGDAPFAVPDADVPAVLGDDDRKALDEKKAELARLEGSSPSDPPQCPSVSGGGETMRVFVRGNPEQLGDAAPPGFLGILQPGGVPAGAAKDRFNRLDLADAVVDPRNPLTARVFVNRVWHYHFGRGIVASLGNFGALGDAPTHPELLDTLAAGFVESGWSVKWLHRQIMRSATYQLCGANDPARAGMDADNRYLWRFSTRRLDVEAWRDAMLAVSGKLDPTMGGPALDPKEPGERLEGFPAFVRLRGLSNDDPNHGRRTVYCIVSRYAPSLTLTMFDFPEPNVASDRRHVTTIPQQQLFVLNSPFMIAMSKGFAARLSTAAPGGDNDEARVRLAWRLAYGRPITPPEAARCRAFLGTAAGATDGMTPWEQLCQAILASNEFAFLP